ncbi:MAG: DinB family protein [Acidobacteriota bacterium]
MHRLTALLLLAAVAIFAGPVVAHDESAGMGFHTAQQQDFERASDKLIQLAEATPADKYSWRPAEGIRSVSENFMHVAQVNFALGAALGAAKAENTDNLEAITEKAKVVAELKRSIAYTKEAFEDVVGTDLDRELPFFNSKRSAWSILLIINGHAHEHLGQAIAYARSNGVVPPWSQ